jgi:SAM-dependent methyltransferase
MPTSYDEILYRGLPYNQTHPDRLATIATLFGMKPAPIDCCRVLEIGCGDGWNLIPMAFSLPGSQFVGFDLAETPILSGREAAKEIGLQNLELQAADIMQVGADLGEFDYIVAHGVYSWVPEPVRDKVLAIVHQNLAPQGVAYVSYNALPGCHIRQMLRDMMLYHLRDVTEPASRLEEAVRFLRLLLDAPDNKDNSAPALLKDEVRGILDRSPEVVFHDELSDDYYPLYFSDFIKHAARHGLQYLSEANIFDLEPGRVSKETRDRLETYSRGQRLELEQYMDFLKCRKFRQTLLCHEGIEIGEAPIPGPVRELYASSLATPVNAEPDLTGDGVEEFRGQKGSAIKTAHRLAKSAIGLLMRRWPETIHFDDLLANCAGLIGAEEADPRALSEILLATYRAGLVELHAATAHCVSNSREFPATTSLVRWQARHGNTITTLRHTTVEANGEIERKLLDLLDGTRDRDSLAAELAPFSDQPPVELIEDLEKNLERLARFGLLTR